MPLRVVYRGKPVGSVPAAGTLSDLKKAVAALTGLAPSRVELRATDPAFDRDARATDPSFSARKFEGEIKSCAELGLTKVEEVFVKDLGAQVGYRTVFYIECKFGQSNPARP